MAGRTEPRTPDLRAAFDRAPALRFIGYRFERALATPLVRKALEGSAKAHAAHAPAPAQAVLL